MNRSASSKTLGYLLALFTVLVWGTTFISTKTLLTVFTPLQVMLTRFVLGQLFLWLLRPRRLHLAAKEEIWFFLMGLFSCSLYFLAENFALLHTQASNVSILITTAPIFTAVLAHFTTEEKLRSGTLLSFLVAFCGVVLVVFNGAFVLKLSPLGDFLSIVAAAIFLDEPIYPAVVAGAVLITAGVVAAGRTPRKVSKT